MKKVKKLKVSDYTDGKTKLKYFSPTKIIIIDSTGEEQVLTANGITSAFDRDLLEDILGSDNMIDIR